MKIALTGGRGRIAPLLARALHGRGHSTALLSRRPGDGLLPMEAMGNGFDWVIHCGWNCVPFTAEQNPVEAGSGNLPALEELVARSGSARVLFMSSGAVYGETGSVPADEAREPAPLGAYARGKLAGERFLSARMGERLLIVRVTNLLLPVISADCPQGVLPRMAAAAREGREFDVWGDGHAMKDYLDFQDFAHGISALLGSGCHGLFNLGSGESLSVIQLVRIVEQVSGRGLRLRFLPRFPWDVEEVHIDISAIRRCAGWAPSRPLREAVVHCVEALL